MHASLDLFAAMNFRGSRAGMGGGGRIGGRGGHYDSVHRLVLETPAKQRARIVRTEVRKYTNHGVALPPSLASYAANYVASYLLRRRGRGGARHWPEDFIKDEAAHTLVDALA
jgi:hypothetical protein